MAVKVFVKAVYKKGEGKAFFSILKKFRSDAMDQKGYISGEHLISRDDPRKVVMISMWEKVENWLNWRQDPDRKALEAEAENLLEEPVQYEVYNLGTFLHK
jgi:heme-degrading monooxygenase HmoA